MSACWRKLRESPLSISSPSDRKVVTTSCGPFALRYPSKKTTAARRFVRLYIARAGARPRLQIECGGVRLLGGVLRPLRAGRRVATEPLGGAQPDGTALGV